MKIVYFTHSLTSCWNHGNAHFLRGVLRELIAGGHQVRVFEPTEPWSLQNLLQDHGPAALDPFRDFYPELSSCCSAFSSPADIEGGIDGADLVIVHEWNEPWLIAALGEIRRKNAGFLLFFHDTHHRAVSDPNAIHAFDLTGYDAILAFGEAIADVYRRRGFPVFVWHEAADIRLFHPQREDGPRDGLVWIGNWGDGERSAELEEFLLQPAAEAKLALTIYGVRYPEAALHLLAQYNAIYRGWLANPLAPAVYARHLATVHVPRRYYASILPGIPTIRVFEALACGIPLISAPWEDSESLFTPGTDYLVARNGDEMMRHLVAVREDAELRNALVNAGLETIRARHTCAHRADELLAIARRLTSAPMETAA